MIITIIICMYCTAVAHMQAYLDLLKCDPSAFEAVAGVAALAERWHVSPAMVAHALCLHLDSCTGLNSRLEPDEGNFWSTLAGESVHFAFRQFC